MARCTAPSPQLYEARARIPVTLHFEQVFQIVQRGVGRRDRVTAFVAPPVLLQVEVLARGRHELPQARGLRPRQRLRVVGAFHEGQQGQLGGHAALVDFIGDEVKILARAFSHALHRLGMRGVVVGPLIDQWVMQIGDGETAADAVPDVARGMGQIDGA